MALQKYEFTTRLGENWLDLADVLAIPEHMQRRFPSGHEAREIWEVLSNERRLHALPPALRTIGRTDLAELLGHLEVRYVYVGQQQHVLRLRSDGWRIKYSPDGNLIAFSEDNGRVHVWGEPAKQRKGKVVLRLPGPVYALAWSPDSKYLAAGDGVGTIHIWDQHKRAVVATLAGHDGIVYSIDWHPGGATLATASYDRTACLWHLETGAARRRLIGHDGAVMCVAWSNDGDEIATASDDGTVRVWQSNQPSAVLTLNAHSPGWAMNVAWSPDDLQLATSGTDAHVRIWNSQDGSRSRTLDTQREPVWSIAWSATNNHLAVAAERTIQIWRPSGRNVGTIVGHTDIIRSVDWHPAGFQLASASDDKTARVWKGFDRDHQPSERVANGAFAAEPASPRPTPPPPPTGILGGGPSESTQLSETDRASMAMQRNARFRIVGTRRDEQNQSLNGEGA